MILHGLSSRRVNIILKVFVGYILPIIEFAAVLWLPHTVLQRQRVELVQRLFARIISGYSSLSYDRRLSLLKIQTLYTRVKISKLIIIFMIMDNLIIIDLNQINLSINTNNTKANGLRLVLPAPHTNIM